MGTTPNAARFGDDWIMKRFILLAAVLLAMSSTLAACNLQVQPSKPADKDPSSGGGGGGY